jgi:AcrR family transcriptional regulator
MVIRSSKDLPEDPLRLRHVATPPTRPVLRERYDRRRRRVVDAAARAFAERGYHAVSIQDLAEATGLAAGGLYHYIGSKDKLLIAICDELMDPLLENARALVAAGEPPAEQLRSLLRLWLAHVETHRDHMLVFQQARHVIEHDPEWRGVRSNRKAFERILDDVLRRAEEAAIVAFSDRKLALLALLGMVNHTATWLRPRGRLSAEQIADGYFELLTGRATPPAPAR